MRCLLHNYPSAFHRVEYVRRGVRRMRLSPYKMSLDAGSIPAASTFCPWCQLMTANDRVCRSIRTTLPGVGKWCSLNRGEEQVRTTFMLL